jgi:peroxiredoxin-like protein
MTDKNDKRFLFNVKLNWIGDTVGLLTSASVSEDLEVGSPIEFGGTEKLWTPEHFFLNAISSCLMTTFLALSKKMGFEILDFNCEAVGQIEIVEGRYKFTRIDLYPKVYIVNEELREKVEKAMEKTHKYCIIANSVNVEVIYHSQVLIGTERTQ